jgi:hypothetical protein
MRRIDVAVPGKSAANGITLALNSKIMCSAMHYWKRGIMRFSFCLATLLIFLPTIGSSQPANQDPAQSDAAAITVYKDFAVVRSTIDLDLKAGATDFTTTKVTRQLEPDSVVLRGRNGGKAVNVLEQNYDAAVVDQNALLRQYEGRTIDFQTLIYRSDQEGQRLEMTPGKIVRAPDKNGAQPIIEVNGKLQFQLPGLPIFPASADSLLLKPTLRWSIASDTAAHFPAELDYVTRGFSWQATYNIVTPEHSAETGSEMADLVGWVTIENTSGTDFPAASVKLMAGDVAKIEPGYFTNGRNFSQTVTVSAGAPAVTQKAFDDFHLYDLHRTVHLRDGETKQIEFLRAAGVPISRKYVYDGSGLSGVNTEGLIMDREFGVQETKKVLIVQEFKNSEANHLGIPIPAGRIRFYRQDQGGQVEFTGESTIDHTPKDATIRVVTGNAFDITGERKQTDFHVDSAGRTVDESFEIKVKNVKETAVKVSVVEHLYRWSNWSISSASAQHTKADSRTIEFPIDVAANGEQTITYTVHYSW